MDKKTNIGLALCFLVLVIFWWLQKPSEEQRQQWQRYYDSIAQVQRLKEDSIANLATQGNFIADTAGLNDSTKVALLQKKYGQLSSAVNGTVEKNILENDLIKVELSNEGGKITNVEVKGYTAYGDKPLLMYGNEDATNFGFYFVHNNRSYFTSDLFFTTTGVKSINDTTTAIEYELRLGEGFIKYAYTLTKGSYEVDFNISSDGIDNQIATQHSNLDLEWEINMPAQEKGKKSEGLWSNVCYRYDDGDVEELDATGSDDATENMTLSWVAYKNQFFSSIFIAKEGFAGGTIKSEAYDVESDYIKHCTSTLGVKYDFRGADNANFKFIFLPNYFYTLDSYEDMEFTKLLPLSWGIFRWINEWVIIPIFKFLENFFTNYGIIILILTIIIKLVILPLTFSSFKSQAKMRVLKPQIDAINEKIPAEKALERNQATMALYKKAGVSPTSGCLPMLLQMPILFAAFRFFPAAIELRGKPLAWCDDLSTYDSILDLPFSIPFYGDHVSLFCLLMCATQLLYTKFTMQTQNTNQVPGMSLMMYLMPLMLLFFFNDYPAGLCYYYFVSSLITILQTIVIKHFFIDEKAILAQIERNKKKPVKKGRFQAMYEQKLKEMEQMQKTQQKQQSQNRSDRRK